ncbi:MAG: hypothetical protein CMN29_05680 [Sandaracinus sp.]|nr:hypothetical protein [Sandaracinus sp.]
MARAAAALALGRGEVDAASLVLFRIAFGALMTANVVRYEAMGWVDDLFVAPTLAFPYWGFEWVRPLPAPGIHALFALVAVAALGIALGAFYRLSCAVFFLAFTYIELIDRTTYLNHYYLVSVLAALLFFMPLHRVASVDAWRRRRRTGEAKPLFVLPRWPLSVLRLQIGLVYVFAGLAKVHGDWLLAAEPLATWLPRHTDLPLVGGLMDERWLAYAMSWAGMLFDLTIPFWLSWRRSRAVAYAAVLAFHAVTGFLFPIGIFPWLMSAAATVFFEPGWPRHFARLVGRPRTAPALPPTPGCPLRPLRPRQLFARVVLGVHFAVQLLLPLRQHLYPGERTWHEQGFRFAWNVMLVEKTAMVDFRVVDAAGGETVVHPREILTPLQRRMMTTQPDMILSFAHHLRDRWAAEGRGEVEVYVDAWCALNGRRRQRFIDPEVDLARVEASLAPRDWVLPLAPRDGR